MVVAAAATVRTSVYSLNEMKSLISPQTFRGVKKIVILNLKATELQNIPQDSICLQM